MTFALCGRIEQQDLDELRKVIDSEAASRERALDLDELRLVDREVVQFLAACERSGIRLLNCPSYIREWIASGRELES